MPSDDNPKPQGSKPSRVPFLMRTQAMGSSGWEAYTIGFTLVGCIVAGAGAGYLLDSYFKTSYWLPILFLVGVVGGFREMWVVLKRVQSQEEQRRFACTSIPSNTRSRRASP
ncbi:MAG: AtpZ/AtpI family protein, partial [Cytophagaceae bacterium]